MQKEDLKQISDLLDIKFDQNFKQNNKALKKEIISEIGVITSYSFGLQEEVMDKKFEKFEKKISIKITESHEEIMTKLKKIEEEQTANVGAHDRMDKNIKDYEVRIKQLETQTA